ncbi:hypothetical protein AK812_SmicGene16184 [Symbiodinium microadriaticum]|uniref:Uncharacterized protein n=1 Tax=Symbiodinium microadriaticum TaxID=2951 RepID=A0A1Q9E106_SYMMI|nr:hypothetical protein AK812_SmicGene16184 [Symbiodinium microadriaticum]CAE7921717.1 unnamed protein product [Symbiodinium sp. KB8]
MYTIRLLQLSGSSFTEFELPPAASISEVLQRARASLGCDPKIRLQLLFEDRPLQMQETLASLGLPGPPFQVDLQLLHPQQPRLVERIGRQTSDFQRVEIGICGQRVAGKTSFLNQYVVNLGVEKEDSMVPVRLLFWDLHGPHYGWNSEVHRSMFRKTALIFVADLKTLQLFEIQCLLNRPVSENVSAERVLVGNKADAAAPGNNEEVEAFATANGLTYFEASAKDHESVDAVLRHILLSVMDKLEPNLTRFGPQVTLEFSSQYGRQQSEVTMVIDKVNDALERGEVLDEEGPEARSLADLVQRLRKESEKVWPKISSYERDIAKFSEKLSETQTQLLAIRDTPTRDSDDLRTHLKAQINQVKRMMAQLGRLRDIQRVNAQEIGMVERVRAKLFKQVRVRNLLAEGNPENMAMKIATLQEDTDRLRTTIKDLEAGLQPLTKEVTWHSRLRAKRLAASGRFMAPQRWGQEEPTWQMTVDANQEDIMEIDEGAPQGSDYVKDVQHILSCFRKAQIKARKVEETKAETDAKWTEFQQAPKESFIKERKKHHDKVSRLTDSSTTEAMEELAQLPRDRMETSPRSLLGPCVVATSGELRPIWTPPRLQAAWLQDEQRVPRKSAKKQREQAVEEETCEEDRIGDLAQQENDKDLEQGQMMLDPGEYRHTHYAAKDNGVSDVLIFLTGHAEEMRGGFAFWEDPQIPELDGWTVMIGGHHAARAEINNRVYDRTTAKLKFPHDWLELRSYVVLAQAYDSAKPVLLNNWALELPTRVALFEMTVATCNDLIRLARRLLAQQLPDDRLLQLVLWLTGCIPLASWMNTVRLDLAWAIQGREDQWPVLAQQYFLNGEEGRRRCSGRKTAIRTYRPEKAKLSVHYFKKHGRIATYRLSAQGTRPKADVDQTSTRRQNQTGNKHATKLALELDEILKVVDEVFNQYPLYQQEDQALKTPTLQVFQTETAQIDLDDFFASFLRGTMEYAVILYLTYLILHNTKAADIIGKLREMPFEFTTETGKLREQLIANIHHESHWKERLAVLRGEKLQNIRFIALLKKAVDSLSSEVIQRFPHLKLLGLRICGKKDLAQTYETHCPEVS